MSSKFIVSVTPPFLLQIVKKSVRSLSKNRLFDGNDQVFKEQVRKASVLGEYGCGASTRWVIQNTQLNVISVDTSDGWVEHVKKQVNDQTGRLNLTHIDLGPLGDWGTPLSFERREHFSTYTDFMWQQSIKPDLVLIDGRFRVCCFLTSLKYADEGTPIIFDDYAKRPRYHVVESYVKPTSFCGRQALFIVPPKDQLAHMDLEGDIKAFRHVME